MFRHGSACRFTSWCGIRPPRESEGLRHGVIETLGHWVSSIPSHCHKIKEKRRSRREPCIPSKSKARQTRAVVLLSGGMDSCVCAALAARDHRAAGVHVSYGQRTAERERRSFESICDRLQIRDRLFVRNEALRAIGGSALTDERIAVPETHGAGEKNSGHGIP